MTEESNIDLNSQEETVITEEVPQDYVEKDLGDLVREAAEAAKKEAEKPEQDEALATNSTDEDSEDEEDDAEPTRDASPENSEPRGRRAKKEYEARLAAEKAAADMKAQIDKLAADNEAMRKLFDSLTNGAKPKEDAKPAEDIDGYLKSKGLDPDNFVDDEAKKAVYTQFKETDALKESATKTAQSAEKSQFENVVNNTYNSLPDDAKKDFTDAAAHVILTEIRQIKALNPSLSDEEAYKKATESYDNAMFAQYKNGLNPIKFIYDYAIASGYTPKQAEATAKSSVPDLQKVSELQKKAGAPAIDVANTGGLGTSKGATLSASQRAAIDHLKAHAS